MTKGGQYSLWEFCSVIKRSYVTLRSTLCKIHCSQGEWLSSLDILCLSKSWCTQCSVSVWGNLLPAFDHLVIFLTSLVLTTLVLRFSFLRRDSGNHSNQCQKWSETQMVCYNLPSFARKKNRMASVYVGSLGTSLSGKSTSDAARKRK